MKFVWSPHAKQLELEVEGRRRPLHRGEHGWWHREDDALMPGQDYTLWVDGEGPLPHPRSPFQPYGVHGPSRHIDHSTFEWTDKHWQARPLAAALIYELHIGTFTPEGTFDGAIQRLDHLVKLGVTHVELMPVAEFLGDYGWGYDGVALYAPHHSYGGPEALKRLVDACHAKGLAVLLDVVYNHLGPSGNYLSRFGPYFTSKRSTPWGDAINYDGPDSDEVRRFFIDNALMWLRDYHFDGLRIDAVHAIVDTSAVHLLEELATRVDEQQGRLGRHLVLIAESDLNDPRVIRPPELGGYGIDAQWSDDIHHSLHTVLTGETSGYYADFGKLSDVARSMTEPYVYAGRHSEFRQRRHGRPATGISARQFIAYLQNHDQLGNRAKGERLSHLASFDRTKIGAALILLSPYVPMLFQGEEWAATTPFQYFVDFHSEPELAAAVAEGRMREFASFGWDPDEIPNPTDRATFERSKLRWEELDKPQHAEMLQWYTQLESLRSHVTAFTSGRLDMVDADCSNKDQWLRIVRDPITILCNFKDQDQSVPVLGELHGLLLASKEPREIAADHVVLQAESVAVFGPGWD